ncbi:unnamed protein product, partial [Urochloa humidicola]
APRGYGLVLGLIWKEVYFTIQDAVILSTECSMRFSWHGLAAHSDWLGLILLALVDLLECRVSVTLSAEYNKQKQRWQVTCCRVMQLSFLDCYSWDSTSNWIDSSTMQTGIVSWW